MSKERPPIVQVKPLYLARDEVAQYVSLSPSMWDQLVARGDAPKPRKLSPGRSAWLVEEIDAWGHNRPVSDLLPPRNSGHGRSKKEAAAA